MLLQCHLRQKEPLRPTPLDDQSVPTNAHRGGPFAGMGGPDLLRERQQRNLQGQPLELRLRHRCEARIFQGRSSGGAGNTDAEWKQGHRVSDASPEIARLRPTERGEYPARLVKGRRKRRVPKWFRRVLGRVGTQHRLQGIAGEADRPLTDLQ
jgi:hypothetical protein